MANQLMKPKDVSPLTLTPDVPSSNDLPAAFGAWFTAWYFCEGTPNHGIYQSTEEINVRFDFDLDGASAIEILPQFAGRGDEANPVPAGYRDAAGDVQQDLLTLVAANMFSDPGGIDLAFNVKGASGIRFLARAIGGTTPTLAAKITAG